MLDRYNQEINVGDTIIYMTANEYPGLTRGKVLEVHEVHEDRKDGWIKVLGEGNSKPGDLSYSKRIYKLQESN